MTQMTYGLPACLPACLRACLPACLAPRDNVTQMTQRLPAWQLVRKNQGGEGADGRPVTLAEGLQTKFILLKNYRCKLFIFYAKMQICSKPCHTSRVSCKRLKTGLHAYTKQRV
jgi:hypothetical protein